MDATFADWFAVVSLRPSPEQLQRRWAAVEAIAGVAKRPALLNLVRVSKNLNGDYVPLSDAARASDETFQTHQCEPELRVLAGAAIAEILKKSSKRANVLALATVTAGFGGTQGDDLFRRVHAHAVRFLADEALGARRVDGPIVGAKTSDFSENIRRFTAAVAGAPPTIPQQVATLVEEVTKAQGKTIGDLGTAIDALREESNMFWWAFAAHSRHLDRSFRDVGIAAACVVGAFELAELTNLIPGPRSSSALLDRLLAQLDEKTKLISVADAVNASDREWRSRWVKTGADSELRELVPVLHAAAKSLETDSLTDWVSSFTKSTGIADAKLTPTALALHAYQENLLVRALEQVKA